MDRGTTERLYGNYRAQVINNRDPKMFGRCLLWIPDLMESVEPDKGIWARPANNPLGGRNNQGDPEHHYVGTSFIPGNGSWVWIFFEAGNINRPYYFGALDLENTKVLPENQLGANYELKWTHIKTHEGRTIMVSDDVDDARVEITGKKREMKDPPTGDTASVYKIDDNMTTILFDERSTKEKILIRTYQGDFIHIDIDERKLQIYFEGDVEFKSDGKINVTAKDDINILSDEGDINVTAALGNINILAESGDAINIEAEIGAININAILEVSIQAGTEINVNAATNGYFTSGFNLNHMAGLNLNQDGGVSLNDQSGASSPAGTAGVADPAIPANPIGERNT